MILPRLLLSLTVLLAVILALSNVSSGVAAKKHSKSRKFRASRFRADAAQVNANGYNCGGTAVTAAQITASKAQCHGAHKLDPNWIAANFKEANGGAVNAATVQCGPQDGHLDACWISDVLRSVWCEKNNGFDFRGMFYHPSGTNLYKRCTAS